MSEFHFFVISHSFNIIVFKFITDFCMRKRVAYVLGNMIMPGVFEK